MESSEIRKRFLEFFEKREHKVIPSASLVPEGDASTLFTTAGMQPLVPYLLGEKHPEGKRLVNVQKCLRTGDIDKVGDNTHLTFFEMLGNWSLGDYWKEEAIKWSYELLTSKKEGFGLEPKRLYITCFKGNDDAPRDEESVAIWKSVGVPQNRIYFRGVEDNWWSAGDNGPAGPDTEMFYDITTDGLGDLTPEEFQKADEEQKVLEIWNDVFMEYETKNGKVVGKLPQKNVDTGAGLERLAVVLQGKENIFETDLFKPILGTLPEGEQQARRIVADHIRAATFIIADGIEPSNTDRGYILRKLIRRAVRHADSLGMEEGSLAKVARQIEGEYNKVYPEILDKREIEKNISEEEKRFRKTLEKGLQEIEKMFGVGTFGRIKEGTDLTDYPAINEVDAKKAFDIFQTYGFPPELIQEELSKRGLYVDEKKFQQEMERHQKLSTTAATGKFKGGLGDTSEMSVKYHTATHLLLAALQKVLGESVEQRGSNITLERLRFDFSYPEKMSDEQIKKVESLVNEKIKESLPVSFEEMSLDKAREIGAHGIFGEKYGEQVKVYKIGKEKSLFSIEICGGPHVKNTNQLGTFKIVKESSSSAGVRRIKAVLE